MLHAAVMDSPASPEKTTGLWDAATVRVVGGLYLWTERDCGCHFRPHSYVRIHSSRHSFLVAQWGTRGAHLGSKITRNPVQHRGGRDTGKET